MLFIWTKPKTVNANLDVEQPEVGRQTRERRRENLMNALKVKQTVCSAARYLAAATAVLGMACVASTAGAQGVPNYVVSSHATLQGAGSGGPQANIAVNSRGDFFSEASGNVTEFPADGGPSILLFSYSGAYGSSGVAVDDNDNLFITVFQGFGGADSGMYEFPFTSGTYPAPYVYSVGSPPSPCYAAAAATSTTLAHGADTNVCAIGSYVSAAYYYWQPFAITTDYTGSTYVIMNYENSGTIGGSEKGFFYCAVLCNNQALGANAVLLVKGLPNKIQAITGNPVAPIAGGTTGDVYWVDGTTVSYMVGVAAQASAATQNILVLDSSYSNPTGIAFDRAGNLYVEDNTGIWETPLVNGTLVTASKFLLFPIPPASYSGYSHIPAIDTLGDVFYAPYYGDIEKGQLFAGTFPSEGSSNPGGAQGIAVGTTSFAMTFTITFNKAVTLASMTALQGNGPATEFALTVGTCTAGSFAAGSTCTFTATFTPSAAGPRSGSVVITDSTGASTVTYLKGIGVGPSVTVDPGTAALVASGGLQSPEGIAVDGAGNVFVADEEGNAVYEFPAGGGAAVSIGSNLSVPTGVAADGAGNVFIVNQGTAVTDSTGVGEGTVVEVPNIAGTLTTSAQSTVFKGLQLPTDIVIDANGNFYISNTGANEIRQYPSVSRYATSTTSVSTLSMGLSLNGPTGLALDAGNRLYIADTGNNQVIQVDEGITTFVGAGLSTPTGVAVDASGSAIVADMGTGRLIRVPNEAGGLRSDDQVQLDSPLLYPTSLRVDGSGNLYGSDNIAKDIYEMQRTSGEVNFLSFNLGTSSAAETIVLSNAGNQPIVLGSPLHAPVPTATGFTVSTSAYAKPAAGQDAGTVCPTASLPAGDNCVLSAVFSPTVAGPVTYPLVFAAPASNTATPTVNLVGDGVNLDAGTVTLAAMTMSGPITYGESFTITFTIAPKANAPPPTGMVVFSLDGQNFQPQPLTGDPSASYTFTSQNAGLHYVQATYDGDANYAAVSSAVMPLTIALATAVNTLTVTGDSATPLSAAPDDTVSFSVNLAPSVVGLFQGTVTFYENGVIMGAPVNVSAPTKTNPDYSAYYATKTLPLGFYTITATYSGNANYAAVTSVPTALVISNPTFTVAATPSAVTATKANPAIIKLNVESYSDFQAGVDFTCAGLPANAYCVFRPGLVTLQNLPYQTSTIVPPVPAVLSILVDESPVVVEGSTSSIGWIGAVLAAGLLLYSRRKRSVRGLIGTGLLVLLSFGGIAALNGCGGNTTNYVTPPGKYLITVTATGTPLSNSGAVGASANNVSTTFQVNLTVQ